MKKSKLRIGFIGQGWVGKHYADDFERRGFDVVRYSKEEPYAGARDKIKKCDVVFVAVPTPTTPDGFDSSIVSNVLKHVGNGKIAVIKSSLIPGTTEKLQRKYPGIYIVHSPEFLRERSAAEDAASPQRNIIGIPRVSKKYFDVANKVMSVLPKAPFEIVCGSSEAELIKYAGNCFLYTKVVYANILYNLVNVLDLSWEKVRDAVAADSRIGHSHLEPLHGTGRGAGGNCFIKDFAAFTDFYHKTAGDKTGHEALLKLEKKNIELLNESGKDSHLLQLVYGQKKSKKK